MHVLDGLAVADAVVVAGLLADDEARHLDLVVAPHGRVAPHCVWGGVCRGRRRARSEGTPGQRAVVQAALTAGGAGALSRRSTARAVVRTALTAGAAAQAPPLGLQAPRKLLLLSGSERVMKTLGIHLPRRRRAVCVDTAGVQWLSPLISMTHCGDCVTWKVCRCSWLFLCVVCPSSLEEVHSQPLTHDTLARPIFSYDLRGGGRQVGRGACAAVDAAVRMAARE